MFENIEKFYQDNHYKLIEDKSEGSLRPGKSFTKDVENCITKFCEFFIETKCETINEERLRNIIGGVDVNTRHQNLRVMREFQFLIEMETPDEDGARFRFTETFKKFIVSGETPRNHIYSKLSRVSSVEDLTMYLNLLICTLREAYLYGQVMLFKDSFDKFKIDVPSVEMRNQYRQRIFDVYGYSGRDKKITDDVYSPNLSYMSRAELENLGLLIMTTKKIDGMNNLVLTTKGYELLEIIDDNLKQNGVETEMKNEFEDIFNHNLFGIHIKEQNDALSEERPHVCIGWSVLGDLSHVESKEELALIYEKHFVKNNRGKGQDIGQIWRFISEVQENDYIIFAEHSEFHIGRVESDYYYDQNDYPNQSPDYKNTRKVRWLKKNISRSILSTNFHNSLKTAMSIWTLNDYKSAVSEILKGIYEKDEDCVEEEEIMELMFKADLDIGHERNRIVFGAPGTGKSFELKKDCDDVCAKFGGNFERVTFHPDYSYSQFVGTYKPVMGEDEKIRYDFIPGPFMRVYVEAMKSLQTLRPQPYILLIEEINRAKVAAVFGDVFQLLDRDDDGASEYEIQASEDVRKYLAKELGGSIDKYKKIKIPNNMFIWATMNSADQGVFPMDTAFKRRWNFEYLGINQNEEKIQGIGKIMLAGTDEPVEWNVLRKAINAKMSCDFKINEDKLMGPFFLSKKVLASDENGMIIETKKFGDVFKSKVLMYLYEDAVKQGKHKFFDGCADTSKYSAICDSFDQIGMEIFGKDFRGTFYEKQKDN